MRIFDKIERIVVSIPIWKEGYRYAEIDYILKKPERIALISC